MGVIKINGKIYKGNSVSVSNNKVIIDGKDVTDKDAKTINIIVEGDIENLDVGAAEKIGINGNVSRVKTSTGDVTIKGDVNGDIETSTGDIKCGNVTGNVKSNTGDIKCDKVEGNATTNTGDIKRHMNLF